MSAENMSAAGVNGDAWDSEEQRLARMEQLRTNLEATRAHIAELAQRHGVAAPELLPVTKFHPARDIALLYELGVADVAENREQEARAKAAELTDVRFHMIGQVQTKKANHVARWAASVHSVDSLKLVAALDRGMGLALERGERGASSAHGAAGAAGAAAPQETSASATLPVFLQVSADGDTARGGVALEELDALADATVATAHLHLAGLMVVPPLGADAREVFELVRARVDALNERLDRPVEDALKLSAGMSGDLDAAIAAGTNIVRVGTGIMGPRPLV